MKEEMEVERSFIGAACNRVVNNVSYGASHFVSFGAQNALAIFCPKTAQILTTLPGHKASVNCTQWLPSAKFAFKAKHLERHYLLSGDANGIILLWELSLHDRKWRLVLQVPESHKKGVTCITAIMVSESEAIFASTASDCSVHIWDLTFPSSNGGDCKLVHLESLSVGSKPMVALSLAELPRSHGRLVLAMGGLDCKIHLYCGDKTGNFVRACELKGHTDWIRGLDFSSPVDEETILLASSSQDRGIRIWKISMLNEARKEEIMSLASYIKGPVLVSGDSSYQVSLESLLIGHEDWVYSVEWKPPIGPRKQEQCILSASMDKTMMMWEPEPRSGVWTNVVTVGELSHCALGFFGGHWSPAGDSLLAHGYGGAFHLWTHLDRRWIPHKVPSGHFAPVSDLSWSHSGDFLLTVSHDQTSRIFAPWKKEESEGGDRWHEIARPQVHGHDMNCVTLIGGKGNQRYVCGADEKVARVFEAPLSFLKTLHPEHDFQSEEVQVLGANMSALGLSQRPIYSRTEENKVKRSESEGMDSLETIPEAIPAVLLEAPIEDQLAYHTLWPESHKLYGHGNELFSLCSNHNGTLLASSCKAQSGSVAEIWLWEVGSWKAVARLQSHTLTVVDMEFSSDDQFLLTVSRDRHFSIFAIQESGTGEISYELVSRQEAHKRIIWACSWNPNGHEFATGSRDKTVKIWKLLNGSSVKLALTLPVFSASVTALSWTAASGGGNDEKGLLAVGLENGLIELWNVFVGRSDGGEAAADLAARLDPQMCHVAAVNRLAWSRDPRLQLASCGADHCVRVFRVK